MLGINTYRKPIKGKFAKEIIEKMKLASNTGVKSTRQQEIIKRSRDLKEQILIEKA